MAVPRPGHTNLNSGEIHCSRCPHPTLLFAQETAQDLILISSTVSNNILEGLEIVVMDYCRKGDFFFSSTVHDNTKCSHSLKKGRKKIPRYKFGETYAQEGIRLLPYRVLKLCSID